MNLKQLEYFVTIAEERKITAAAKRLHITQPPLSYEMASLEKELGVKLFIRKPRGVELTDAGRLLYSRATTILGLTEAAVRDVSDVGKGREGTLAIGIISSSGGQVPNEQMRELTADYPSVSFDLREGNTYEVLEMLRRQVVELGVIRTPFSDDGLICHYADPEPMAAIMAPGLVCGEQDDKVNLGELSGKPLVIYRRFEKIIRYLFEESGLECFISCINDDARTTCMWADKGFGIGLVPSSFLSLMDLEDTVIKRVDEEALITRMAVVWLRDRELSPLAARFVSMFDEAYAHESDEPTDRA